MGHKKLQKGMTFWGLSFVLGVLAFFLFLLFKLLPPYLIDLKVSTALNGLAQESDVGSKSKIEITQSLYKRFDVDDITHVELKRDLTLELRGRTKIIRIRYETVVPMAFNISALLEFEHVAEVKSGE